MPPLALLALLACAGGDESTTGEIPVARLNCEAQCWEDAKLEVSSTWWGSWLDGSACGDTSISLNYDGTCYQTQQLCESDWQDDPALGEVEDCCGGIDGADLESLPLCGG